VKNILSGHFEGIAVLGGEPLWVYLDIADVRVSVFQLSLPRGMNAIKNFSSYKLSSYRFLDMEGIINSNIQTRTGVFEAVAGYKKYLEYLERDLKVNPFQKKSFINAELAQAVVDIKV